MKTLFAGTWMTAVLLAGQLACGQENWPAPGPAPEAPDRAIELRHKQLDIEQREAEIQFNNDLREIQLEQKRMELNRDQKMKQNPDAQACPGRFGPRGHHQCMKHLCALMFLCAVVHVLLAIWVYQDIRKRNAGSGVWIVIALLTGLLGALVYAVVRLGDKPAP